MQPQSYFWTLIAKPFATFPRGATWTPAKDVGVSNRNRERVTFQQHPCVWTRKTEDIRLATVILNPECISRLRGLVAFNKLSAIFIRLGRVSTLQTGNASRLPATRRWRWTHSIHTNTQPCKVVSRDMGRPVGVVAASDTQGLHQWGRGGGVREHLRSSTLPPLSTQ